MQSKNLKNAAAFILVLLLLMLLPRCSYGVADGGAATSHRGIDCAKCHNADFNARTADKSLTAQKCSECHDAEASKVNNRFHLLAENRPCTECHSFHRPSILNIKGDSTSLMAVRRETSLCFDCHRDGAIPDVIAGHRVAARVIHADKFGEFAAVASQFCLSCHDENRAELVAFATDLEIPRFSMTGSHPNDVTLIPGYHKPTGELAIKATISPRNPTVNGKITCLSCHSLLSRERNLLVATTDHGELCRGCHEMGDSPSVNPVFTMNKE